MECDPRSSSGSTVSGDLNKTINPFGYMYIFHPFGALENAQIENIQNFKEKKNEDRKMSFRCPEYYRTNLLSHQNSVNVNDSAQNQIKEQKGNSIVFEVPDFKYIIDSIRRAWYTSNMPLRHAMLKNKNQSPTSNQDDETIGTNIILKRPKELIRRYSVPETAIRKYKFIFEHSCTKNNRNNIQMNSNFNNLRKNWKYQEPTDIVKHKQQNSPLDLLCNLKTPVEKPLTMPEIKKKKECFYCSSKKNNSIEKFEQSSKIDIDTSDNNSKQTINSSDIFISDLLIDNLNEDMTIAELLINTLNHDNSKTKKISQDLKEEHYVSSIYFSPESLLRTNNTDEKLKIYRSYTDINLKSELQNFITKTSEEKLSDTETKNVFSKLPINHQQPVGEISFNKSPTISKHPKSTIMTNDNDTLSTPELKMLPIESNNVNDNELNPFCREKNLTNLKNDYENKSKNDTILNKQETLDLANFKQQIIESGIQKIGNNYKTPLINDLIKTPLKIYSPCCKQGTISKSILNSLEAYTFDSGGNINFRVLSSAISKHECSSINSDGSRKSNQKKKANANNVRKITIFEAQSNRVTPDNDNGPKRFYQKTEIVNGDKKIDILEIVECIQNSMDYKPKSVFNTKISKIPILIDKFKFIKNEDNNHTAKSITQPKLSKIEKHKIDKKYEPNIREIFTTNEKNDFNMPKLIYPLENVTKPHKINSKVQAVKPLRPLTDNLTKEVALHKYFNLSGEYQKEPYATSAYNSTVTDRSSLQNTITPSSGIAIHGSTSHNITLSEEFTSKPDYSTSLRANKESFLTKTKLDDISNLNKRNNLENTKTLTRQVCQYGYKRQNKLNAWRIPSSDFYDKNKNKIEMQMESMPKILPKTTNAESTIKCNKNICNNNCQLCSCCSTFTANSRIVYSPTLSVCSLCSKICNSERLTTCNTDCTYKGKDISQCNKNCNNFPPITNRNCECMAENLNVSYLCNQQQTSGLCQYSGCSKIDDLMFPEGVLSNSRIDFTSEGLVTASSSIPESHWKSTNELLSCNWKLNKNQSKTFNIPTATIKSSEKNTTSNSVWTVTVTTKSLPKAPDLTMEFKFPQPPTELTFQNNNENEENDNFSLDSDNSMQKNNNHSEEIYTSETKHKTVSDDIDDYYDKDFGGYSLNLPRLLTKRNGMKLKPNSKNLSVMGNAIAPEEKPRVQTMSERDLTRRKCHRTIN